jgi:hypothetical protein
MIYINIILSGLGNLMSVCVFDYLCSIFGPVDPYPIFVLLLVKSLLGL